MTSDSNMYTPPLPPDQQVGSNTSAPMQAQHASQDTQSVQQMPHPVAQPAMPVPVSTDPSEAQPYKHTVHKSYIWLGTLRALPAIVFAIVVSAGGSIASLLFDEESGLVAHGVQIHSGLIVMWTIGAIVLLTVVIALIVVLVQWWSYKHLYFTVTDTEFSLYSGIFNKKQVHIPYERIQSVDEVASLLQRVLGVCNVSIDTAGGSANKTVSVPYLTKSQAEWLRRELFLRRAQILSGAGAAVGGSVTPLEAPGAGGPVDLGAASLASSTGNVLDAPAQVWSDVRGAFAGVEIDTGKTTYEYGLSNGELVLTGFSNNTGFVLVVLGVVGALASLFSTVFDVFEPSDALVDSALKTTFALVGQTNVVVSGVIAFVAGCVILWILSALGTCISYGGFKARRKGSRVEVEYGLLKHQYQGVDISRVQSVVIKQTFIRRLFGYGEVSLGKIDSAADQSGNSTKTTQATGTLVIHPFVKMSRVPEILAGMVPEFADVPQKTHPVARVALRRGLIRNCILYGGGFWLLVVAALVWAVAAMFESSLVEAFSADEACMWMVITGSAVVLSVLGAVLMIVETVNTIFWARESSFGYNRCFMQITNGGLSRQSIQFPRQKIQYGYTKTNPFQRRAHTATLVVYTAAGVGGTKTQLIDSTQEDAFTWLSWLIPRGNVEQEPCDVA